MHTLRAGRRQASGADARGITSAQDQDLLRAMLVFACAGLDAAMKTLIRDALPALADHHTGVQKQLADFTVRTLSDGGAVSPKVLARILTHAEHPRVAVIEAYVDDLTGGSLQSADELDKVCTAFGIDDADLRKQVRGLRPMFQARNQIIHELDFTPEGRLTRRTRPIGGMVHWASDALLTGQRIVSAVSLSLRASERGEPSQ
jgi:YD repeat-containing protein